MNQRGRRRDLHGGNERADVGLVPSLSLGLFSVLEVFLLKERHSLLFGTSQRGKTKFTSWSSAGDFKLGQSTIQEDSSTWKFRSLEPSGINVLQRRQLPIYFIILWLRGKTLADLTSVINENGEAIIDHIEINKEFRKYDQNLYESQIKFALQAWKHTFSDRIPTISDEKLEAEIKEEEEESMKPVKKPVKQLVRLSLKIIKRKWQKPRPDSRPNQWGALNKPSY